MYMFHAWDQIFFFLISIGIWKIKDNQKSLKNKVEKIVLNIVKTISVNAF